MPTILYQVTPINYEGCDPIIAKYLQKGLGILCHVESAGTREVHLVIAYDYDSIAPYITHEDAFAYATPYIEEI